MGVADGSISYDFVDGFLHYLVVVLRYGGNHNLLVDGGCGGLLVVEQLFIEFFARTEPGFHYLDVLARAESGECYHFNCQVVDFHRFSHVEHIDFAAVAHAAGFEHQRASLVDGHKVANDVLVGDCYRTTLLNLTAEDRDYRTVRTEHVAKSGGDELRV